MGGNAVSQPKPFTILDAKVCALNVQYVIDCECGHRWTNGDIVVVGPDPEGGRRVTPIRDTCTHCRNEYCVTVPIEAEVDGYP